MKVIPGKPHFLERAGLVVQPVKVLTQEGKTASRLVVIAPRKTDLWDVHIGIEAGAILQRAARRSFRGYEKGPEAVAAARTSMGFFETSDAVKAEWKKNGIRVLGITFKT
jgi:long-subunit acyl-CoA synthetase (AMP-forming)